VLVELQFAGNIENSANTDGSVDGKSCCIGKALSEFTLQQPVDSR